MTHSPSTGRMFLILMISCFQSLEFLPGWWFGSVLIFYRNKKILVQICYLDVLLSKLVVLVDMCKHFLLCSFFYVFFVSLVLFL
ncbi:hypothetical protein M153_16000012035 [Pseudoloma neurophilia]|uniref:Uncharacterized protein n=1 Tax=Pseudoloma neurophilia TaxID=146866 RepID=A0A0R0M551_9MICR|nr:hypothetical protein M153_16000012035 [Pseudoloma neurophilia]